VCAGVSIMKLDCYLKGRMRIGGVYEQGAEENIWT